MNSTEIMIPIIAITVVLLGLTFFISNIKNKKPTDYYGLFKIGLVWVLFGIIMAVNTPNYILLILGIIFMIAGLVNKNKWLKTKKKWQDYDELEKRIATITVVAFLVLYISMLYYILFAR